MMIIFKNFFSFALTFKAYDWIIANGIRPTMIGISTIQVGVCLLSIPMCKWLAECVCWDTLAKTASTDIYGKRVRAFYHRHDLLEMTGLR